MGGLSIASIFQSVAPSLIGGLLKGGGGSAPAAPAPAAPPAPPEQPAEEAGVDPSSALEQEAERIRELKRRQQGDAGRSLFGSAQEDEASVAIKTLLGE